jgi:carboxyl-terminal processing protease
MLLATVQYLDQPLVRDLSSGNRYLAARRLNIHIDPAQAYALQCKKAAAFEYLRKVAAEAPVPSLADFVGHQKAFESVRDDPEFAKILSSFRVFDSLWDSPELATSYKENLSDAEKVAGLSKFWSEVKYNFGFPEKLVALHWDKLYLDWIPRVLATKSTTDYYRQLMLLCARLSDGHTNVYAPMQSDLNAKPPLRTGLIEGRIMTQEARSPALNARAVRAGMEIVEVDGEPALTTPAARLSHTKEPQLRRIA